MEAVPDEVEDIHFLAHVLDSSSSLRNDVEAEIESEAQMSTNMSDCLWPSLQEVEAFASVLPSQDALGAVKAAYSAY